VDDDVSSADRRRGRVRRRAGAAGLLAAGAITGGFLASTLSASAASNSAASNASTSVAAASGRSGPAAGMPGRVGGAAPVRPDEHALSTANAAKVRAAALKAVPGGTVYRVETDAGDGVYEAHMTKADGTPVTVKLDKNFTVTSVESGMGRGDPAPANAGGSTG
jgi:hypothetical protein